MQGSKKAVSPNKGDLNHVSVPLPMVFDRPWKGATHHARPMWMQEAVAFFLENFVTRSEINPSSPNYLQGLEKALTENSAQHSLISMLDVVSSGFRSLQDLYQTNEMRLMLHENYCNSLTKLRVMLASFPYCSLLPTSVFLLALYQVRIDRRSPKSILNTWQMITSASTEEKAWQIHLTGILALLRQGHPSENPWIGKDFATSIREFDALRYGVRCKHSEISSTHLQQPHSLLNLLLIELGSLTTEMDAVCESSQTRRKLDILKIHNAVRRIFKDLKLVTAILPSGTNRAVVKPLLPLCHNVDFMYSRDSHSWCCNRLEVYTSGGSNHLEIRIHVY